MLANTFLFIVQRGAVAVNFCLQQWKKLLKSDSICQSYAEMKKGPVFFLTHTVCTVKLVNSRNGSAVMTAP